MRRRLQLPDSLPTVMFLLVAACSGSSTGSSTPPPPPPPPPPGTVVLAPNAIVVDSTVLHLLSSEAEHGLGTFRFEIIGAPVPVIVVGTVLIGAEDGGFLRRVTSVATAGEVITLQTASASLTDAVERGNIQLSFVVDQPTGGAAQLLAPTTEPPPFGETTLVQMGAFQPSFLSENVLYEAGTLSLSGRDLCKDLLSGNCPAFVSLTIEQGSIGFSPTIDAKILIENRTLKEFRLVATGTLALDLLVKAVASQQFMTEGEIKLAELSANFAVVVGGIPLTGVVTFKFMAGFTAQATLETSFQTGAAATTTVSAGAQYANDTWEGVWETNLSTTGKNTEWTAQADGNVRVYVRPELDLRFYHIVGPSIQVEPWVKAEGHIGTQQCELDITAGIDSKLSLVLEFLSVTLASWDRDFNTTPLDVFKYPCPIGTLEVTTTTTGINPDTDGYTVTLDGGDPKQIAPAGTVLYTTLPPAPYLIGLDGIAANCTVAGGNPRQAAVTVGDTTKVAFTVECAADTGDLEVSVTTTGDNPDPDGYTVKVDGVTTMPVGTNGSVTFAGLAAGDHAVSLEGIAANCLVVGDLGRTASVASNGTVQVAYELTCAANEIAVTAQTGGTPIDPDGYTITLDGVTSRSLDVNGSVSFSPVTAGPHTLVLTDLASNCAVNDDNPRNIVVVDGTPATTTFVVSCSGGSLSVTTMTTGSQGNLDPDGFSVVVDGTETQAIDNDGQVSFPGLAAGPHTVELQGVDAPCVVLGFNPRTVDVPGTEAFEVSCGDAGSAITFERSGDIWQVLPDGNGELQLTTGGGRSSASWSPDGTRMVYIRTNPGCGPGGEDCSQIYTADADGSNEVQLTFPAAGLFQRYPSWSPDGMRILFDEIDNRGVFHQSIMTMNTDGSAVMLVRSGNGTNNFAFPSWTPDGRILYAERVISASTDSAFLAIMNSDGSGSERLTTANPARVYESAYSIQDRIVWKRRLYQTQSYFDLFAMDYPGGGNFINLSNGTFAVRSMKFSPDGNQIAFTLEGASGGLWIMDTDGSNMTQLAVGGGVPAWRTLP